jgi:hypothetical protein
MRGHCAIHLQIDEGQRDAVWTGRCEHGLEVMFEEVDLLFQRISVRPLRHQHYGLIASGRVVHELFDPSPWHEYFGVNALSVRDGHIVE